MVVTSDTDTTTTNTSTSSATTTRAGKRKARKNNKRAALYDTAQARLRLDYKANTTLDTTAQPYNYWTRIPSVTLNASRLVFTGTTGCNSMSGNFNFSSKDIQFGRNIVTSKMSCNEYDETKFISALKKADNYTLNGNTLELKQGNTLLLTFKKA
jgi:heat shock protein HslJ